ncbi:transposase [Acidithiobacillus sp. M4-SHS-6]|uniref:transposase n=1 Tax=Acidithiobacillus sp. M4-SHS-6 TaxID=3383024 RepID=UPI0039BEA913
MSDEQTELQLMGRRSFQHFCGLEQSANILDRTTIWNFENRVDADDVAALFAELDRQIRAQSLEAHAGQIMMRPWCPLPSSTSPRGIKRS